MVSDLEIDGKGQYLRGLFSGFEKEAFNLINQHVEEIIGEDDAITMADKQPNTYFQEAYKFGANMLREEQRKKAGI
jgi:hypothetical protein